MGRDEGSGLRVCARRVIESNKLEAHTQLYWRISQCVHGTSQERMTIETAIASLRKVINNTSALRALHREAASMLKDIINGKP